jgi:hypothetical protein
MRRIPVPSFLLATSHCFYVPAVHGVEEEFEGTMSDHDDDCLCGDSSGGRIKWGDWGPTSYGRMDA